MKALKIEMDNFRKKAYNTPNEFHRKEKCQPSQTNNIPENAILDERILSSRQLTVHTSTDLRFVADGQQYC